MCALYAQTECIEHYSGCEIKNIGVDSKDGQIGGTPRPRGLLRELICVSEQILTRLGNVRLKGEQTARLFSRNAV